MILNCLDALSCDKFFQNFDAIVHHTVTSIWEGNQAGQFCISLKFVLRDAFLKTDVNWYTTILIQFLHHSLKQMLQVTELQILTLVLTCMYCHIKSSSDCWQEHWRSFMYRACAGQEFKRVLYSLILIIWVLHDTLVVRLTFSACRLLCSRPNLKTSSTNPSGLSSGAAACVGMQGEGRVEDAVCRVLGLRRLLALGGLHAFLDLSLTSLLLVSFLVGRKPRKFL